MRWEGPGYQKSRIEVSQVLMTFNCQRRNCQADSLGFTEYTNLEKMVADEEGKKEVSFKTV